MVLPSYDDLRTSALRMIGNGRVHHIRGVIEGIAAELGVSDADRALRTPKMHRLKFDIDVESAVADLRKAAWLKNTELGVFRITGAGRAALSMNPKRISLGFLRKNSAPFREREARNRRRGPGRGKGAGGAAGNGMVAVIGVIPAAGDPGTGGGASTARGGPLRLLQYVRDLLEEDKALGRLETAAFSGTLFMAAEGVRRDLLLAFARAVWPAVTCGIREDVQVSGCVACGRFERPAENWVAGPAADEAAAHLGAPHWVGISAAPSAGAVLEGAMPRARYPDSMLYARRAAPPGAAAGPGAWAVNWPGLCGEEDGSEVEELAGIMDDRIEAAPDAGAALRWWNTRRFCENALSA